MVVLHTSKLCQSLSRSRRELQVPPAPHRGPVSLLPRAGKLPGCLEVYMLPPNKLQLRGPVRYLLLVSDCAPSLHACTYVLCYSNAQALARQH
jgi:hypothetical protein